MTRQLTEARFRKVLFENPWYREDIPSLVAADETGSIIGFLGTVPRPMTFQGDTVWMAVTTQLMADPGVRGLIGRDLLMRLESCAQDFTFADLANDGSRTILEMLGSTVAKLYSLYWTRPLRPARFALQRWGAYGMSRNFNRAVRPFSSLADLYLVKSATSPYKMTLPTETSVSIDARRLCELHERFIRKYSIAPANSETDLAWLISQVTDQLRPDEALKIKEVKNSKGGPVGWFAYVVRPGAGANVVQIGGNPRKIDQVLAVLFHEAYMDRAVYVSGRMQPEFLSYFSGEPIFFNRRGPWVCINSKRLELTAAVLEGKSWLTRLEGEWWMGF